MNPFILLLSSLVCFSDSQGGSDSPSKPVEAKITGETYLGVPGNKAEFMLGKSKCEVQSLGDLQTDGQPPKSFKIVFSCGDKSQVLWDITQPSPDDFSFDDPKFKVLWAGDQDGDGRIDLKMDLSPKYSCSKEVLFLSGKADSKSLVGVSGDPKTKCGE